jgi:hypothetical protein
VAIIINTFVFISSVFNFLIPNYRTLDGKKIKRFNGGKKKEEILTTNNNHPAMEIKIAA